MKITDKDKAEQDRFEEVQYLVHQGGMSLMEALSLNSEQREFLVKKIVEDRIK